MRGSAPSRRWHGRRSAGFGAAPQRSTSHEPPASDLLSSPCAAARLHAAPPERGCALARRPRTPRNVPGRGACPHRRRRPADFRRARDARVPHVRLAGARLRARTMRRLSRGASGRVLVQGPGGVPELHRSPHGRTLGGSGGQRPHPSTRPPVGAHRAVSVAIPPGFRPRSLSRGGPGLRSRAARLRTPPGPQGGRPGWPGGAVTAIQRFGSALNLNVHFHTLVIDGVIAEDDAGRQRLHPMPPPSDEDVGRLLAQIRRRVLRLLERRGISLDEDSADTLAEESPALAGLAAASVRGCAAFGRRAGRRIERLGSDPDAEPVFSAGRRHAHLDGSTCTQTSPSPPATRRGSSIFAATSCAHPFPRAGSTFWPTAASSWRSAVPGPTERHISSSSRASCSSAWPCSSRARAST